jgi:hypothetical protein
VTDETKILKNGARVSLKDLHRGDELWVRLDKESRTILEMEVFSAAPVTALEPTQTKGTSGSSDSKNSDAVAVVVVKGTIGGLDLQSNTILLVTEKAEVRLHVTDETTIFKDGEKSSLAQLEVKDKAWATVRLESSTILKMDVRSPEGSTTSVPSTDSITTTTTIGYKDTNAASVIEVRGAIQAIYPDSYILVILTDNGVVKLLVTRETTIYKNGAESTFSNLEPHDLAWAAVSRELHTALKIEVHSPKPATTNEATYGVPSKP